VVVLAIGLRLPFHFRFFATKHGRFVPCFRVLFGAPRWFWTPIFSYFLEAFLAFFGPFKKMI